MCSQVLHSRARAGPRSLRAEQERIRRIRRQIAAGTYVTDAKIAVSVERLWKVLNSGGGRVRRASA